MFTNSTQCIKKWPVYVFLLTLLPVGNAMAFFESMKINLFSDMKGIVTLNGEPVDGAVIKRLAKPSNKKEFRDQTVTDAEGRFELPVMETSSFLKLLPMDSSVYQMVTIEYLGNIYEAWKLSAASDKYKGELNSDEMIGTSDEIDIDLVCELTSEVTAKKARGLRAVGGICTWSDAVILK
ncbi:DUF6795 domain-containing protein [Pseudomonadota bacterium]